MGILVLTTYLKLFFKEDIDYKRQLDNCGFVKKSV